MGTIKCKLEKRGKLSHEWNDGERDHIYCLGRIDLMTDELLPECKNCSYNVNKAQEDLEKFWRNKNGT